MLGIVKAENRPVLAMFIAQMLPALGVPAFRHVTLIDGNDECGMDVGLVIRNDHAIGNMRRHVDDRSASGRRVVSRAGDFARRCFRAIAPSS